MEESSISRNYELVEELRAEIDFELEDVITEIVRELPEEYYERTNRADQIVHLKALLALSFCKLQEELMFRSGDGSLIAVIARQNYSGQLANILSRLPREQVLVGAKIFTSQSHNFIIDLFEFAAESDESSQSNPADVTLLDAAGKVSEIIGNSDAADTDEATVAEFLSHYSPNSEIFSHTATLTEHFLTYQQLIQNNRPAAKVTKAVTPNQIKLTVASRRINARDLVHRVSEYLGQHKFNIVRAFLNDLLFENSSHVAIASFRLDDLSLEEFGPHTDALSDMLSKLLDEPA